MINKDHVGPENVTEILKKWSEVFVEQKLGFDNIILWSTLCDSSAAREEQTVMDNKSDLLYKLTNVILCPI